MAVNKRGKVVGGDWRGGLGFYGNTEVQVPLCSGESSRALEDSIHTAQLGPFGGLDGVECTDMFCWLRAGLEILNKS